MKKEIAFQNQLAPVNMPGAHNVAMAKKGTVQINQRQSVLSFLPSDRAQRQAGRRGNRYTWLAMARQGAWRAGRSLAIARVD